MFLNFLFDNFLPEIVYNINDYIQPTLIEFYNLGKINRKSYSIYKEKLNELKYSAYLIINSYTNTTSYNIIFDKYLSIVIHQPNSKFKFNFLSGEYLDHVYDNNFIVIYINNNLEIIKTEFRNCYDIEIVMSNDNYYILYDSYGVHHYELTYEEALLIKNSIKHKIKN